MSVPAVALLLLAAVGCQENPVAPNPDGIQVPRMNAATTAGTLSFRQVSAGEDFTCGVTTENRAYCWGDDFFAQLGDGNCSFGAEAHTPVAVLSSN
jgi:alpha-tubulin suppressor-like RCC1 family protein